MHRFMLAGRVVGSIGAIALITGLYAQFLLVNPTTVALTYLIAILLIATAWGIVEATTASVAAVLCFNFFFLPPVGTLTIADPQNWVALLAFLATAIVASQLSGRARRREIDAAARRRDLERLYTLSRALLLSERGVVGVRRHCAPHRRCIRAGVGRALDRGGTPSPGRGPGNCRRSMTRLREVARQGMSIVHDPSGMVVTAIQLGGVPDRQPGHSATRT